MFKNPLRKYQAGGTAPTQEQQELLAAFVEWLPQRIEEFANMQPEQIVEALNGMSKTEEGQKQVQGWMEQFKKEMQGAQPAQFKEGGKIHQFLCKHAKGGHVAGCGCDQQGGTIDSGQHGLKLLQRAIYSGDTRNPEFSRERIRVFKSNYAKPEFDDVQLEVTGNDSTFVINRPGEPYYTVNNTNPNKPLPSDAKYSFNSVANWWNASKQNFTNKARLHTQIIPGKTLPLNEAKIDIKNPNLQNDLQRMKSPSLSMQEGGAIEAQNGGYLQSDTPEHAAALAARKTTRVPWPGVGRRRMGAAMDNNGGKYLYERGDVNGNTAQTSVSIPAPGDTIVRQSVATMDGWDNRTYPEGTDEYESVMKRFRPFVEYGIPAKQDGGGLNGFSYDKMSPEAARYNKQFVNAKADSGRRFGWKHNVISNTPNEKIETISLKEFPDSVEGQLYTFPNTAPKDSVLVGYPVERTIGNRTVINNHMPGWEQARDKWFEITKSQQGGEISRRDMFNQANENRGFNRSIARTAYANALNGLRAGGLRGRELRQAARRMVVGEPVVEEPVAREPIGELKPISVPVAATTTFSTKLAGPTTFGMTQEGLDKMSFNDAFATARREGNSRFIWRGKAYTTELASEQPKQGPALWGNEGFMWNDSNYTVPYGQARLRHTFLRQDGGTLSDQYGTIDNDTRTPVRRWIDNVVGNSSTLSSVARGLNNFKQSAPGKVIQAMLPDPETGMAGAATPMARIAKAAKVRIPTQKTADNLALLTDNQKLQYFDNIKPNTIDFDIDKLYGNSLNFDKFDAKSLIQNPPTMMQRFTGWVKGQLPKTTADWNKVGAGFTGGAIAGSLGMAGLVKAGQSKQNKSNK